MRRQFLQQQAPLLQRLPHQLEVELFQVAQATVDQLAGPARRPGGEVTCLDQSDRKPARGRVERDTGTGHSPADDQDVELFPNQFPQCFCPVNRRKLTHSTSTQSSVRPTAFDQPLYPSVRCASDHVGDQRLSSFQFCSSSSLDRQNPTASPAA